MTTLVALRTNAFGPSHRQMLAQLADIGHELVVIADERAGRLDTAPYRKASLTQGSVWRLGVRQHPNMAWLCGDYALALLAQAFPEAQHFWLIEPDMRFNMADPRVFFSAFAASNADVISHRFEPAPPDWFWRPHIEPFLGNVHHMLFAGIRMSRRAIAASIAARRQLPGNIIDRLYPNDEALVATVLGNGGFEHRTFAEFGRFTTNGTYSFARPLSGKLFDSRPPDGMLYHPVVYGADFVRKARAFIWRYPSRKNLEHMLEGIEREMGAEAAAEFAAATPAVEDMEHEPR